MIFMVLSRAPKSSPRSSDECRLERQVAANSQTKPANLACESAIRLLPSTSTIAILLLLSRKSDTHFVVPRRVEGLNCREGAAARAPDFVSHWLLQ